ncbi:tRNA-splicing endonuclease subunit Sen34-like isoform X2 [Penaeus monodon]|uniref:tRNA-splicing endonuclease subunit Sen34-like isoform X1 n=1 Tax=Penaeus monodon TaxID=6687 RepID=UPI0018A7D465|nr:tRNA-splicing endonuclease subunit Sen34-like isoform X1 [Penaeus monodon]XP_037790448.1 tRNA-splicing endonuclease subunit Sen34-like isoform X2 [Penaeus monodon]
MDAEGDYERHNCVNLILTHGRVHVWNAKDADLIRRDYRIVGNLVGALPRNPHQVQMLGLPLQLMPEEVTLLIEKDFVKLVEYEEMKKEPASELKEIFNDCRERCYEEQVVAAAEQRKREIEIIADKILSGKRKKLEKRMKSTPGSVTEAELNELTHEKVIEEECKKIQRLPEHLQVCEIFVENPLIKRLTPNEVRWPFPSSNIEKLRYAVFKDMWERDYYLTNGIKFGGDFLVYPGDPVLFHAKFIVKCVEDADQVNIHDLVTWSRIGTSTKKTLVVASFGSTKRVEYKSYQWVEGENHVIEEI